MKPNPTSAQDRRGLRAPIVAVLAVAALLSLPVLASAAHWPNFGGDAGHSSNQPVNAATMAVEFLYRQADSGSVRTSVITSGGDATTGQRVAYGKFVNASGANDQTRIHIRDLATGEEKVSDGQQVIDDDTGGDGAGAGSDDRALGTGDDFVTPVSSSSHGGLGQLYVVHNDENSAAQDANECPQPSTASDNDIALAQFDEATGEQRKDVAVGRSRSTFQGIDCRDPLLTPAAQVTNGYVIESSPVLTPALDAAGRRWLFFVARDESAGGNHRLFGVEIENAGSPDAVVRTSTPQFRNIADLNTKVPPAIAFLEDPATNFIRPYVLVAVNAAADASDVRAYKVGDIGDTEEVDLEVPADVPGHPQAISVPVTEDGHVPGTDESGEEKAPALYVSYRDEELTQVRMFTQTGSNEELSEQAASPSLDGTPGRGLAVSATLSGGNIATDGGSRVLVPTGQNLYVLHPTTLELADRLRDEGETPLEPGTSGFARNAPSTSGGFAFIQDDGGIPYVLRVSDGERVDRRDFTPEQVAHLESDFGLGQPAYSNGFLQFLTDRGLFVYQTGIVIPPNQQPVARFSASPNPGVQGQPVQFDAGTSTDPEGLPLRYEWDFDGNGTFEVDQGNNPQISATFPVAGTYNVRLRVTDTPPNDRVDPQTDVTTLAVVINPPPPPPPNKAPIASFTARPSPAKEDERVVFDATASSDPDGTIVRYEWDLDGNGTFETNSGTNPRTQRSYRNPAVYNVRLRVTDNGGASTETTRQLTVGAGTSRAQRRTPRRLTANVRPRRDTTLPFVFRTTGRLTLPRAMTRREGCNGRVTITIKVGQKTVSRRTTRLSRRCTYRSSVTFRDRQRIGNATRIRVIARFQGNRFLKARQARTARARIG